MIFSLVLIKMLPFGLKSQSRKAAFSFWTNKIAFKKGILGVDVVYKIMEGAFDLRRL
jgi:hypothetical protein